MRELDIDVHLFSAQEILLKDMPLYLGNAGQVLMTAPTVDNLAQRLPGGVALTLGSDGFSVFRRWQEVLRVIAAFDPDLVLFVGLNSPLITPLFDACPVLGLCVHSTAPMAPVDLWLASSPSASGRLATTWGFGPAPGAGILPSLSDKA